MQHKVVHMIAFALMAIGAINWLLVGAFNMDLVVMILGAGTAAKAVYILVGLGAIYEVVMHKKHCTMCHA